MSLFLTLPGFLSCTTPGNITIYQSDTISVVLRNLPVKYPSIQPFQHPYTVQPKATLDILESLNYDAGSFLPFSRSHPRSVLTKLQAKLLAPELSKALALAPPQYVAAFMINDTEKPDRRTKGLVFVLDDELHVIIDELRTPVYQGEQKTYQQQVPKWELHPVDTQRHYASRPGGKGAITNWIIIPLRQEATQHE